VSSTQGKSLSKAFAPTEGQILLLTAKEQTEQDASQGTSKQDQGWAQGNTPS